MVPHELIESRVDYLTATCLKNQLHEGQSFNRALEWAYDAVQVEHRKGNDLSPWRSESFEGMKSGQICVGRNEEGLLFRVSGDFAAKNWRTIYQDASNVSRIDCAATIRLTDRWSDLSRVHHDEALLYQKERSPHLRVTRIDGGKHGNTLNIGSRASEGYGRIYDKFLESHAEEYRDCWRYEVEFKKRSALLKAAYLATESIDGLLPASISLGWFQGRGLRSLRIPMVSVDTSTPFKPSDDSKRLAWISRSVSPVVRLLIEHGRRDEVLTALGLSDMLSIGSDSFDQRPSN
jgi:DNA relaxase NicK